MNELLERDLTKSDGLIAKLLPADWHWTRIPDAPHKNRTGVGFDGVLWCGHIAYPVEVKLKWKKLNDNELEVEADFKKKRIKYLIMRYFGIDGKDGWLFVLGDEAYGGTMVSCCTWLIKRTWK